MLFGTVFIASNGLVQFWQPLASVHWAVYATLEGFGIIGSGVYFEKKRHELIARGQQIIETLKQWD